MLFYISTQMMGVAYRGVEQLVARRAHNPEVVGSNPAPATTQTRTQVILGAFFIA